MTSGERISCADQVDRASDSEWPLRAAQFLKPPALPGDTYMTGGFRRNHQRCAGLLRHLFAYFGIVTGALVASIGRGHGRHFFVT